MEYYLTHTEARQTNVIRNMDALRFLQSLPSDFVDCIVTSPPYFGLRNYGVTGQMGQEKSPDEYVANMVRLFREARRVLKPEGNFWLNMGDGYGHNKQLLMTPHRLAIALQDDGWWVRQDNVWHKPNPMPESVTDRTTRAHEYVFHLTKSERYYYDADAIKEPAKNGDPNPPRGSKGVLGSLNGGRRAKLTGGDFSKRYADAQPQHGGESHRKPYEMVNRRSVWTITPANYKEAHFATFPERLAEICILTGCPPGGLVLDMFMGAGTTAVVSIKTGRRYVGSELNPAYVEIAEKRIRQPLQVDMFKAALQAHIA